MIDAIGQRIFLHRGRDDPVTIRPSMAVGLGAAAEQVKRSAALAGYEQNKRFGAASNGTSNVHLDRPLNH